MKFVRSALVVAAATMVPLMPTAAHADRYVATDTAKDVVKLSSDGSTTPEPTRNEGDIVRSSVVHKAKRVVVTMRFAELSAVGLGDLHIFSIRSNKLSRVVTVDTGPGHWGGKVTVSKPNGKKVSCSVRRTISYSLNTATVSVPRRCLGNPRWVKVAMQHGTFVTQDDIYVDDAFTNARIYRYFVYGPRVYR
jgi:hypothetical protein